MCIGSAPRHGIGLGPAPLGGERGEDDSESSAATIAPAALAAPTLAPAPLASTTFAAAFAAAPVAAATLAAASIASSVGSGLPKGPTGKPARIGLAERLGLPLLGGADLFGDVSREGSTDASAGVPDTWEVVGGATGATGRIHARPCAPERGSIAGLADHLTRAAGDGPGPSSEWGRAESETEVEDAPSAGASLEARVLWTLRRVWAEVLQLPAAPDDGSEDDVPFAAVGGDSLLGATLVRLAAQRGLHLGPEAAAGMEAHTVRSLAAGVRSRGGAPGEPPATAHSTTATEARLAPNAQPVLFAPNEQPVVFAPSEAVAPRRALRIIERDRRRPRETPTHVGGLTACATGDAGAARYIYIYTYTHTHTHTTTMERVSAMRACELGDFLTANVLQKKSQLAIKCIV